jgi:3-methyladenine DNA glycosylase/8-oxoguanine DNA glycosylase
MGSEPLIRDWQAGRPVPIGEILGPLAHGLSDPFQRRAADGAFWRASLQATGPATLRVQVVGGQVHAEAWGTGAEEALTGIPDLLGERDDLAGFVPRHELLVSLHARFPHFRVARTGQVFAAMLAAILEQKVTGKQAHTSLVGLLRRAGSMAPGPGAELGLWVPPTAEAVAGIPSWEWLRMQVEPSASRTLVHAASRADALERTLGLDPDSADRALRSLPGVGVWTSAEVRSRAHGDPDAVSFGDYHVPRDIGWALTGSPVDDAGLAELLAPYSGHRYRVQALIGLAGIHVPRRGPRMALPTHLPR